MDLPLFITSTNTLGRGLGLKKIKKLLNIIPNIIVEYEKMDKKILLENIV